MCFGFGGIWGRQVWFLGPCDGCFCPFCGVGLGFDAACRFGVVQVDSGAYIVDDVIDCLTQGFTVHVHLTGFGVDDVGVLFR